MKNKTHFCYIVFKQLCRIKTYTNITNLIDVSVDHSDGFLDFDVNLYWSPKNRVIHLEMNLSQGRSPPLVTFEVRLKIDLFYGFQMNLIALSQFVLVKMYQLLYLRLITKNIYVDQIFNSNIRQRLLLYFL